MSGNRVLLVARVSTQDQAREERGSLERQEEYLRETASRLELDVVACLKNAASGAKQDSKHFTEITKAVDAGTIDAVMFASVDRFCRNVLVGLGYINEWIRKDVDVYFSRERVDLDNSSEVLVLIMQMAAAQFQRDKNAEGSRARHHYAEREGRWYGRDAPWGYAVEEY